MGILKRKKYPWEEDEDEEEEDENPADWSLREELEKAFEKADEENDEEQEESNAHEQNLFSELDTSDMNLRDELEAKFDYLDDEKKPYQMEKMSSSYQNAMPFSFAREENDEELEKEDPYIFSEKMRNLLGKIESGNDYLKVNSQGGGFGALGKYQIRRDGFKDMGYINQNNQWVGKNNIYSNQDYLNDNQAQEKALNDFMQVKYKQLKNNGSYQYLGYPVKGIVDDFDVTDTGLLAASHREGAGAVHNYLSHLEKDQNGRYYIDYDKISDPKMREMFKRIETRLRRFAQ